MNAASRARGKATVYVVDSDATVRNGLQTLLKSLNADVRIYGSAQDLLQDEITRAARCLICEIHLPDMSAIELMQVLQRRGIELPTIVLASTSDVPTAVRAMQQGAVDFIDKPFVERVLLARIHQVLNAFSYASLG